MVLSSSTVLANLLTENPNHQLGQDSHHHHHGEGDRQVSAPEDQQHRHLPKGPRRTVLHRNGRKVLRGESQILYSSHESKKGSHSLFLVIIKWSLELKLFLNSPCRYTQILGVVCRNFSVLKRALCKYYLLAFLH